MTNVQVLSLSVNKITSLADFAYCKQLVELYIRKNEVSVLAEVKHLRELSKLRILWLCDNPCASQSKYRAYVLRILPGLEKLDNIDVTSQERQEAAKMAQSEFDQIERSVSPKPSGDRSSPTPQGGRTPPRRGESLDKLQRNLVTAVLALADELSPTALEVVYQDIASRIRK